jgi:hypothetical protein
MIRTAASHGLFAAAVVLLAWTAAQAAAEAKWRKDRLTLYRFPNVNKNWMPRRLALKRCI